MQKPNVHGSDPNPNRALPGFRHVLEAGLFFGALSGVADVSFIIFRSPDPGAGLLENLRFFNASAVLTSLAFLAYLIVLFPLIRLIASWRKWPLALGLALLYALAILPIGVLICRSMALFTASKGILVTDVKTLYYFLKYLWVLVPVSWGLGLWLGWVRAFTPNKTLMARITAYGLAAMCFLVVTPHLQELYLLSRANELSEVTAGAESGVISIGAFLASLLVLAILWPLTLVLSKPAGGSLLGFLWLAWLVFPFIPPILAGPPTSVTPPSGNPLSGRDTNVMLVSFDTARYDDTEPFGSDIVKTPTLASIARDGVCFDNVVTSMPLTGPSHMSMLTGLQPDTGSGHGVKSNGIPLGENVPTLAEILNDAGYRTAAIIGGFSLSRQASGLQRGFNYYHDLFNEGFRARFLPDAIWSISVSKILRKFTRIARLVPHGAQKPANLVTDQAIGWLDTHSDKPFFMFVHYFDPHYLYSPPPPFDTMYMPDYNGPYKGKAIEWYELMKDIPNFTQDDFDYYRALYRGEISFADQEFGRLVKWGDEHHLWENTLLIVVSDHGESFEHNYYFSHPDRVYESLIHVPLIIREPDSTQNVVRGSRINTLVNPSDLFFTVLDWANVSSPRSATEMDSGVAGPVAGWDHNLIGLLDTPAGSSRGWNFVLSQSFAFAGPDAFGLGRFYSMRGPNWKLIYAPDASPTLPEFQYFDLDSDPNEMNDIFSMIKWESHPIPLAPDILREWASRQGEIGTAENMDPGVRAQLKALGYIQEGGGQPADD